MAYALLDTAPSSPFRAVLLAAHPEGSCGWAAFSLSQIRQEVAMLFDPAKRIALESRNNERLRHWGRVPAATRRMNAFE